MAMGSRDLNYKYTQITFWLMELERRDLYGFQGFCTLLEMATAATVTILDLWNCVLCFGETGSKKCRAKSHQFVKKKETLLKK